jgi:hypothetical protein
MPYAVPFSKSRNTVLELLLIFRNAAFCTFLKRFVHRLNIPHVSAARFKNETGRKFKYAVIRAAFRIT